MKNSALLVAAVFAVGGVDSYVPKTTKTAKPLADLQKTAAGAFAAFTIASSVVIAPPAQAVPAATFSSSQMVAAKVIREGVYGEYEVDVPEQVYDEYKSTFKSAKETKSKKGKYTALLAILIVGSFIIPMAQYFWYVRDDDSTEKFFNQKTPDPEPPKKKGWF